MFDPKIIRNDFPLFKRHIHGKPIVYLDSAATSLKPEFVLQQMNSYYREYSANIHRGIYHLSEEATARYEEAREKVANFIHANSSKEVIFVRNATEGINMIATSFGNEYIYEGDGITTLVSEHHANFVPWQQLAKRKNANFYVIPVNEQGEIDQLLLGQYITQSTKVFAFAAVSNVLGIIHDVSSIVHRVKKISPECLVIIDAAQAIGHIPVDVRAWGADVVVFSGHKMFGPTGIGVVWAKYALLERMSPYQYGGDMIREVRVDHTSFADPPQKFEAGTPAIAEAIGLGAAVDYINSLGLLSIRSHEQEIMSYAMQQMKKIDGIHLYGPDATESRGSVLSFSIDGVHPHDIAQILNEDNVCIRAGHHCAMPLHIHLGVSATARISCSVFTTEGDIDHCVASLNKAVSLLR